MAIKRDFLTGQLWLPVTVAAAQPALKTADAKMAASDVEPV